MEKNNKRNANSVKNAVENLNEILVQDATTTKGKASAKVTITQQTETETALEKTDKNKLFASVSDYFCPVKFDASDLEKNLSPLVSAGVLTEDAKQAAINKSRAMFLEENKEAIEAANNKSFSEVIEMLKANKTLYNKVLEACNISELKESNYIEDGKVLIYRASQCTDKDGANRYIECFVTSELNGVKFSSPLFVEKREITTTNILLAIRYYNSKLEAQKRVFNQISDYKRILSNVYDIAKRAKENGFSIEQVTEQVKKAFEA